MARLAKKSSAPKRRGSEPTQTEAEEAVRTLIRWAGDDPAREGLLETPARVTRAYKEFFQGYSVESGPGPEDDLRGDRRLRRDDRPQGHALREPLRASHGGDHRPGAHRLPAEEARGRHQQAGAPCSTSMPSACRSRRS